jgi:hypothetical protein
LFHSLDLCRSLVFGEREFVFLYALHPVEVDDAVDVVVAVDNVEVDVDVDVGSATIGPTASGSTAATATVVGGTGVGATVVGGTVVGATVVGAIVVGATVVEVVVGTIFRVAIAVAFATFEFVPMPN